MTVYFLEEPAARPLQLNFFAAASSSELENWRTEHRYTKPQSFKKAIITYTTTVPLVTSIA